MEKRLDAICEDIVKEIGSCERKMVRRKPYIEIIRYLKETNIDLIVMASHGLSGLEHVLFGKHSGNSACCGKVPATCSSSKGHSNEGNLV